MDLQLTGKTALVTGASRGIGLAIVRALVAEGATVIGCARTMSSELADSGAEAVLGDLSTATGPSEVVRAVLEQHGDLDILINNVGGGDASDLRDFFDYDDDLWHKTLDLNLFAAVRTCRAAVSSVVRRRGVVVNISSLGARMPQTGPVPDTTAKAARRPGRHGHAWTHPHTRVDRSGRNRQHARGGAGDQPRRHARATGVGLGHRLRTARRTRARRLAGRLPGLTDRRQHHRPGLPRRRRRPQVHMNQLAEIRAHA
jgi:short subunit dehydrogenase